MIFAYVKKKKKESIRSFQRDLLKHIYYKIIWHSFNLHFDIYLQLK